MDLDSAGGGVAGVKPPPGMIGVEANIQADELMQNNTAPLCNEMMSMSMLMDGFGVSWDTGTDCVIFLFENYELNSVGTLISAYGVTLVLGLLLHLLGFGRVRLQRTGTSTSLRVALSLLYVLQVGTGYLLMLVVMTYRADLLVCVLVALFLGQLLFNSKIFFQPAQATTTTMMRQVVTTSSITAINGGSGTGATADTLEAGRKQQGDASGGGGGGTSSGSANAVYRKTQQTESDSVTVVTRGVEADPDPCCADLDEDLM
jgi:hypothetical protein